MAGLLTVRCLSGCEVSVPVHDELSVFEIRQRFAAALGMVHGTRGLAHSGHVLASNRAVAELLGLPPDHVVVSSKGSEPNRMLDLWRLDANSCLGRLERGDVTDGACQHSCMMEGCGDAAGDDFMWQVDAVACLESSFGSGFVLIGR